MSSKKRTFQKSDIATAVKQNLNPTTGVPAPVDLSSFMDKTWDDVKSLHQELSDGMGSTALSIIELSRAATQPTILGNMTVEEQKEVGVLVEAFSKDIDLLKTQLDAIHSTHVEKTGKVTTEEEIIECVGVIENYKEFGEIFIALTDPVATGLADIVGGVAERNQRAAILSVPPVSDITDVAHSDIQTNIFAEDFLKVSNTNDK